jgi:hypothetical protein
MTYSTASHLPTFEWIPFDVAISAGFGYICAKIADSSPSQWAKIFAITSLANNILFLILSAPLTNLTDKCIVYSFTSAIVGTVEIIALRQFNLIGTTGTAILGGLMLWITVINLSNS